MLGALLALAYVGFNALNDNVMEPAVVGALDFLWWWNIVWAVIAAIAVFVCFIIGIIYHKESTGILLAIASPALAVVAAFRYALLLTGVYLMSMGVSAGATFAEWDMTKVVIGCIVYVLTLMLFRVQINTGGNK